MSKIYIFWLACNDKPPVRTWTEQFDTNDDADKWWCERKLLVFTADSSFMFHSKWEYFPPQTLLRRSCVVIYSVANGLTQIWNVAHSAHINAKQTQTHTPSPAPPGFTTAARLPLLTPRWSQCIKATQNHYSDSQTELVATFSRSARCKKKKNSFIDSYFMVET